MQILNISYAYYAEHFSKYTLSLFTSGRYINSYMVFTLSLVPKALTVDFSPSGSHETGVQHASPMHLGAVSDSQETWYPRTYLDFLSSDVGLPNIASS